MNDFFAKTIVLFVVAALLLSTNAGIASAHRFHTSLTRIDYNDATKSTEITVQIFSHDLENVLERRNGKKVDLERTPNVDQLIQDYLNSVWTLKNAEGETKKLKWIGKEQQTDAIWLYLETEMPEGLQGATLENRIYFDLLDDQINLVIAKFNGKKADLVFKPGDKPKEINFQTAK